MGTIFFKSDRLGYETFSLFFNSVYPSNIEHLLVHQAVLVLEELVKHGKNIHACYISVINFSDIYILLYSLIANYMGL